MVSYDIWGHLWDGPLICCVMQNYTGRYKNLTLWHAVTYGYRDPHDKPKTVWLPSQVYNGNPYTDKTASS